MKLRDKKTGESYETTMPIVFNIKTNGGGEHTVSCESITELNEKWEDVPEEPKEFYFIDQFMSVSKGVVDDVEYAGRHKAVNYAKKTSNNLKTAGNYFETEEEAEKAVERLRAWERLKDKGFRFEGIKQDYTRFFSQQKPMRIGRKYLQFNKAEDEEWMKENWEDLDLLFSQEEK